MNPSKRKKYNRELLLQCETRDRCKLITYPEKLNREDEIRFICSCGNEHKKTFRLLEERGAFCKPCMIKISIEKRKLSTMEKYEVEHTSQRPDVKLKIINTCMEKYKTSNPMQNEDVKKKQQDSLFKNHRVYHPSQSEEIRNKARHTMIKRHGGPTTMQSNILKEKVTNTINRNGGWTLQRPASKDKYEKTMDEKYGGKHPMLCPDIKAKIQQIFREKYNSISPFGNKEIQEKSKDTNISRYGFTNAMQNGEILKKQQQSSYKYKEYSLPDGKTIDVQGYEHYILNYLFENNYNQNEIITGIDKVPNIKYMFENKEHVYFCDIFIPKENKIIEVKSKYTYEKELERNILKKEACIRDGYDFKFYMYDEKSKVITIF